MPSVEKVLEDERIAAGLNPASQRGITRIVREKMDRYRERLAGGEELAAGELLESIRDDVRGEMGMAVRGPGRVINATGVILHTNLGRAVLGDGAIEALSKVASGYSDLETDVTTGDRVHRDRRAARLVSLLTGAESALIVNNTAAAVLLAVDTFARRGAVAVSRGELVEIGGSFRLPEILRSAAGRVIEIGTTNRTRIGDYEAAIDEGATLLLKVHTSNYRIVGYTETVSLAELVELGRAKNVPVMYDQGNGILFPLDQAGLKGEEDVVSILESGVDMLAFSADKVLGGPQAGVILGRAVFTERMRGNHLSRALRVDKLTLACLEAVLVKYWNGSGAAIPAIRMIKEPLEHIRMRAGKLFAALERAAAGVVDIALEEGESSIGGGSFPVDPLPTMLVGIGLPGGGAMRLSGYLRSLDPAVVVRVKDQRVAIDIRTVLDDEEDILRESLLSGIELISGRE